MSCSELAATEDVEQLPAVLQHACAVGSPCMLLVAQFRTEPALAACSP